MNIKINGTDVEFNFPYKNGQELVICYKEWKKWNTKHVVLSEFRIDEDGITWCFLNDAHPYDENYYELELENDQLYIFTSEVEAQECALSLNCLDKLTE